MTRYIRFPITAVHKFEVHSCYCGTAVTEQQSQSQSKINHFRAILAFNTQNIYGVTRPWPRQFSKNFQGSC